MKRIIALVITIIILFLIIRIIDVDQFIQALSNPDWFNLSIALLLFIPLFAVNAIRWQVLVHKTCHCTFLEAVKLILASNTLNLILPSKMGDLSKAFFLKNTGATSLSKGFNIVVFEKLLDLSSLGVVFLVGLFFYVTSGSTNGDLPSSVLITMQKADLICFALVLFIIVMTAFIYFVPFNLIPGYRRFVQWAGGKKYLNKVAHFFEEGQLLIQYVRESNVQIIAIVGISVFLWFLHMTQVFFFFKAVGVFPEILVVYHWAPVAVFVGLLPLTLFGIGLRDGALIFLFQAYASQALLFAASVLITLRYLIPGVAGLPFLSKYVVKDKIDKDSNN